MSKARFVQNNVMETSKYFTDNYRKIDWVMDYCEEYGGSSSKGAVAYLEDVWKYLTEVDYGDEVTPAKPAGKMVDGVYEGDDGWFTKDFVDDGLHQGFSVDYLNWETRNDDKLMKRMENPNKLDACLYPHPSERKEIIRVLRLRAERRDVMIASAKRRDEHLENTGGSDEE